MKNLHKIFAQKLKVLITNVENDRYKNYGINLNQLESSIQLKLKKCIFIDSENFEKNKNILQYSSHEFHDILHKNDILYNLIATNSFKSLYIGREICMRHWSQMFCKDMNSFHFHDLCHVDAYDFNSH